MDKYRFLPNQFAKQFFGLTQESYEGKGMPSLLEGVLGKQKYEQHVVAQDPLCGGNKEGEVSIIVNKGETEPTRMKFRSIGQIQKFEA